MIKKESREFIHSDFLRKNFNRGFTLIEILVVIAIIGILSGIILVALGSALKIKARDARIISEMNQIRISAGVYYNIDANNYSFSGFSCATLDPNMPVLCNDIIAQGGTLLAISADDQDYCAEVKLNSGDWWCVDAKGKSEKSDTDPDCSASVYVCEL